MNNPEQIARIILKGFEKHFSIFQNITQQARSHFINAEWSDARKQAIERISLYDQRVKETVTELRKVCEGPDPKPNFWQDVKFRYMGLLYHHSQPELAETFYNSVFVALFRRHFYNNEYIFVRPCISTERLDTHKPVFLSYYPVKHGWRQTLEKILGDADIGLDFEDMGQDVRLVAKGIRETAGLPSELPRHFHIQVLRSIFYRNKSAYVVGRAVIGGDKRPFIVQLGRTQEGKLYVRHFVSNAADTSNRFSSARAYFLVDTEIPSAVIRFLLSLLPDKTTADLYTQIGFHKQGKAEFYRDFLDHIQRSSDLLELAPGSKGLVMTVFTLPSYPYVFKIIRDQCKPPKDITRQAVIDKYHMIKLHDRVGRMSDAWEFSYTAFPIERFSDELLNELKAEIPSQLSFEGDQVIIKHLFIERRLEPLDIFLKRVNKSKRQNALDDYGNAINEIAAAGLFPGDLLLKNFGITRHGRVIFYDYDEVVHLHECNFRKIPPPRYPEDEFAAEPWYSVAPNDVFPEEFSTFLFSNPDERVYFSQQHARLLDASHWQSLQESLSAGRFPD